MEAECNALLSHYYFQSKIKEKLLQVIGSVLVQQDTFAVLPTGYGKSTCYMLPLLILDKIKINIVQFMDQFQISYQSSACPLVSMIKLLKRRIIRYITSFFVFFFVNGFYCVFSREFQHNLFVCNILSKRPLKHRPSAQNTFIDVTILKIMVIHLKTVNKQNLF